MANCTSIAHLFFLILTRGYVFFFFIDFQEKGKVGGEREASMWKRNINQLPPECDPTGIELATKVCALTRDQSWNLFSGQVSASQVVIYIIYKVIILDNQQPQKHPLSPGSWFNSVSKKLTFKPSAVSNLWPVGHTWLRMAMNSGQHKIINLLKTLWVFCGYMSQCT